jgi:hypothetical protein
VSHVHRRLRGRDFYFLANVGASEARFTADFRVHRNAASLWNPMNGEITPLPILAQDRRRTQVALTLPPCGSLFVCLTDRPSSPPHSLTPSLPHSLTPSPPHPLTILWRVTFDGPDTPPPYETQDLTSWTGWPGARYFSGRATYTGAFEWPLTDHQPPTTNHCLLRFDQVREVAEVVVNGQRAGAVWTSPYELEIGPYLKSGRNRLEITVANLPVNRVLGLPDPDLTALRAVYGERFPDPEEKRLMSEPAPSGIIGRIMLLTGKP